MAENTLSHDEIFRESSAGLLTPEQNEELETIVADIDEANSYAKSSDVPEMRNTSYDAKTALIFEVIERFPSAVRIEVDPRQKEFVVYIQTGLIGRTSAKPYHITVSGLMNDLPDLPTGESLRRKSLTTQNFGPQEIAIIRNQFLPLIDGNNVNRGSVLSHYFEQEQQGNE